MLVWPPKDPGEFEDFDINWLPRLGADTIIASVWAITTAATTPALVIPTNSFSSTRTKAWLSGGLTGQVYVLKNTVTTAGGDTLIENVSIACLAK